MAGAQARGRTARRKSKGQKRKLLAFFIFFSFFS
jgi:hypothetical protein